jgi:hypothetical protein
MTESFIGIGNWVAARVRPHLIKRVSSGRTPQTCVILAPYVANIALPV